MMTVNIMFTASLIFGADTAGMSLTHVGLTGTILYKNSNNVDDKPIPTIYL